MQIECPFGETETSRYMGMGLDKMKKRADCDSPETHPDSRPHVKINDSWKGCCKCSRLSTTFGRHRRSDSSGSSSGTSSPQTTHSSCTSVFSAGSSSSGSSPPSSYGSFSESSSPSSYHSRSRPRILVSSLLSDPYAVSYHLEVVQQPMRGAEFRNAPLSRLPISPPVVVRLVIRDTSGNPVVPNVELPFLIAHLSLYGETGRTRIDSGFSVPMGPAEPILYGNLVSSITQLEDLQGNKGLFFIFPDASVRWRGRYQLGVTLLRISECVAFTLLHENEEGC
ncbi:hypothetical protein E1B28_007434 [Marasmius oreades]|uniref:Velvet domain-containing protein n=1 Tax=Marasmius oreades TaxID=181124 RepID=A0A9P7S1K1_9AGAR|nr:uncharacterized protein E1B28_007434 [Marasmius oreades]KAG7093789.1 hypothetical protein E1B28_007434 [Marasmius oreades]